MAYFYVHWLCWGKICETHHKQLPSHGWETGSQQFQMAIIAMPTHWVCWQTCFGPKDVVIIVSGLFLSTPKDMKHHITTKNFASPRSGLSVCFAATFSVYHSHGIACRRVLAYRGFMKFIMTPYWSHPTNSGGMQKLGTCCRDQWRRVWMAIKVLVMG